VIRDYSRAETVLIAKNIQNNGNIGQASAKLIDTSRMAEVMGKKIQENPIFLIKPFRVA
jgi:hypothetical protein